MIIILNGSIGVGKTAVSWELLPLFERAVMLDGDYFAAINPFSIYDSSDLHYVYRTMVNVIRFHQGNGYKHFILNYVFETPAELQVISHLLEPTAQRIKPFLLHCDRPQQEQRIRRRATDQVEWELERSLELNEQLRQFILDPDFGQYLDTTNLSVEEVANKIRTVTQNEN